MSVAWMSVVSMNAGTFLVVTHVNAELVTAQQLRITSFAKVYCITYMYIELQLTYILLLSLNRCGDIYWHFIAYFYL